MEPISHNMSKFGPNGFETAATENQFIFTENFLETEKKIAAVSDNFSFNFSFLETDDFDDKLELKAMNMIEEGIIDQDQASHLIDKSNHDEIHAVNDREEAVLVKQEAVLVKQEATFVKQEAAFVKQEAVLAKQEAAFVKQEAAFVKQETVLVKQVSINEIEEVTDVKIDTYALLTKAKEGLKDYYAFDGNSFQNVSEVQNLNLSFVVHLKLIDEDSGRGEAIISRDSILKPGEEFEHEGIKYVCRTATEEEEKIFIELWSGYEEVLKMHQQAISELGSKEESVVVEKTEKKTDEVQLSYNLPSQEARNKDSIAQIRAKSLSKDMDRINGERSKLRRNGEKTKIEKKELEREELRQDIKRKILVRRILESDNLNDLNNSCITKLQQIQHTFNPHYINLNSHHKFLKIARTKSVANNFMN
jgi:hypothetical protein